MLNVELAGDYCARVAMANGITLDDFLFLNPELFSNCTNLLLGYSYCRIHTCHLNYRSTKHFGRCAGGGVNIYIPRLWGHYYIRVNNSIHHPSADAYRSQNTF